MSSSIWEAARRGDLYEVRDMLDEGQHVDQTNNSGSTPLHHATRADREEVVRLLVERAASVNHQDDAGWSALHWSSSNGFAPNAIYLLEHGARVDIQDTAGRTPLHMACRNKKENTAVALIYHGADMDITDNDGKTCLDYVNSEFAKVLMDAKEFSFNERKRAVELERRRLEEEERQRENEMYTDYASDKRCQTVVEDFMIPNGKVDNESLVSGLPMGVVMENLQQCMRGRNEMLYCVGAQKLHDILRSEMQNTNSSRKRLEEIAHSIDIDEYASMWRKMINIQEEIRNQATSNSRNGVDRQTMRDREKVRLELSRQTASFNKLFNEMHDMQLNRACDRDDDFENITKTVQVLEDLPASIQSAQSIALTLSGAPSPGGALTTQGSTLNTPGSPMRGDSALALRNSTPMSAGRSTSNDGGRDPVEFSLYQFETWQREMAEKLAPSMAQTNFALQELQNALERETRLVEREIGLIREGHQVASKLTEAAQDRLHILATEDPTMELKQTLGLEATVQYGSDWLEQRRLERDEIEKLKKKQQGIDRDILQDEDRLLELMGELDKLRVGRERIARKGPDQRLSDSDQQWLTTVKVKILDTESEIAELKVKISQYFKEQRHVTLRLKDLANSHFPELLQDGSDDLGKGGDHSFLVERTFGSYTTDKLLGCTPLEVWLAQYDGEPVVLKKLPVPQADAKEQLETEVANLLRLKHPGIAKIDCVFYENPMAYLQTAYRPIGNLREWLSGTSPPPGTVQNILRLVFEGLGYIHDMKFSHGNLKPENILVESPEYGVFRPLISDFGISRDYLGKLASQQSRSPYEAPESADNIDDQKKAQGPMDMYSMAIIMHEAVLNEIPRADQEINTGNDLLNDLIVLLMERTPEMRIPPSVARIHPYFLSIIQQDAVEYDVLGEANQNIEELYKAVINTHRKVNRMAPLPMKTSRSAFVGKVLDQFRRKTSPHQQVIVELAENDETEETAIKDMFCRLFKYLFEEPDADKEFAFFESPKPWGVPLPTRMFLPAHNNDQLKDFESLGRILGRAILDGRQLPLVLAPSFYKFLIDQAPDVDDLMAYDHSLGVHCKRLLATGGSLRFNLSFKDVMESGGDRIRVNDDNKLDYVERLVNRVLIDSRATQLRAIRTGLEEELGTQITQAMSSLSWMEVAMCMCGHQYIDTDLLKKNLEFVGFGGRSNFPRNMCQLVDEWSQLTLQRFLCFTTGSPTTESLQKGKIVIQRNTNPVSPPIGHINLRTLDIPDHRDFMEMKRVILQALTGK